MNTHRVTIVTDLGYGDAGKGSVVDYLARCDNATAIVRFNGGAQAAHNVHTPDGQHHTFHQFGSGTLVPGVVTHLSRFMLVNPLNLWEEASRLAKLGVTDATARLTIDEQALVLTPYHQAANRLREVARGGGRHGSCGEGIGEAMADSINHPELALRIGDLRHPRKTRRLLEAIRLLKLEQLEDLIAQVGHSEHAARHVETLGDTELSDAVVDFYVRFAAEVRITDAAYLGRLLATHKHTVFEGAQGVLLDEWHGFHPYTTWSTTTNANAQTLLDEQGFTGAVTRLGLLRAYHTRHGAGPFVTEDPHLTAEMPDPANGFNTWQENFRVGYFDFVAARYALDVAGGIDGLVITCLDRLYGQTGWQTCIAYKEKQQVTTRLLPKTDLQGLGETDYREVLEDLGYQEAITDRLLRAAPLYASFQTGTFSPEDADDYIELIETTLGVPVVLTSTGPTAADKHEWSSALLERLAS